MAMEATAPPSTLRHSSDENASVADSFDRAQQQALEMLFQQCVEELYAGENTTLERTAHSSSRSSNSLTVTDSDAASLMDFLAQACDDANDKLAEVSSGDVTRMLADAVAATQKSLRDVQSSVNGMLADPAMMQTLTQQFDEADEQIKQLQLAHAADRALLLGEFAPRSKEQVAVESEPAEQQQQLALPSNEESLRSVLQFADSMCGVLDNALATISKDEYELAAQLSLGIAQKLLEAGQSLFMSIGDDSRLAAQGGDRADRITIEELADDDTATEPTEQASAAPKKRETIAAKRQRLKREQRNQAAAVRTLVLGMADKAQKDAADHPVVAAAIGMVTLPFIGLAIPVASMVGLALILEKYYPEHTSLTLEMFGNFVQMAKLWLLLVKISVKQLASVAKQCLLSWHDHAVEHGYIAASMELITTGCSLGWLCVSYVCTSVANYAHPKIA